ncbi:hypothetical protein [Nonomuraea gerenzanensis]|uniref:hypothetical protein n=1 Tax=Nonomuraea gerenzanensis TaxID=93944 RepID=UPI001CD928F8|nr:hypothetical protein [Nonomuraea gerenzanensis]UBU12906.1 hypothetical protein LCN96_53120 [Nonomuraea gerenzanensis]
MTVLQSGHITPIQTVPLWALNASISAESLPKLWAVRLTVPAGAQIDSVSLHCNKNTGAAGSLQAALYEHQGNNTLPFAWTNSLDFSSVSNDVATMWFHNSVTARDTDWPVWLVLKFTGVTSVTVPCTKAFASLRTGDSYTHSTLDEFPITLFSTPGLAPDGRYPLVWLQS